MAPTISASLRTGAAMISIPKVGPADSMARWKNLVCGDVSGLAITATRLSFGAISFSSSSHFPPVENSYDENPVIYCRRDASDEALRHRIGYLHKHHRYRRGGALNRGKISRRGGKNDLGRKLDQFLRESGGTVGIAAIPAILDAQISAIKKYPTARNPSTNAVTFDCGHRSSEPRRCVSSARVQRSANWPPRC
jgi:hypothetical protein